MTARLGFPLCEISREGVGVGVFCLYPHYFVGVGVLFDVFLRAFVHLLLRDLLVDWFALISLCAFWE